MSFRRLHPHRRSVRGAGLGKQWQSVAPYTSVATAVINGGGFGGGRAVRSAAVSAVGVAGSQIGGAAGYAQSTAGGSLSAGRLQLSTPDAFGFRLTLGFVPLPPPVLAQQQVRAAQIAESGNSELSAGGPASMATREAGPIQTTDAAHDPSAATSDRETQVVRIESNHPDRQDFLPALDLTIADNRLTVSSETNLDGPDGAVTNAAYRSDGNPEPIQLTGEKMGHHWFVRSVLTGLEMTS